ncbi:MAG: MGMT family protein [Brevibacterium yomogidense]|uniref:MGMT family protein n=1 Tax=Brevibacterium sp. Mu109 TaxID=1255669 RepID=UPI000C3B2F07|nr:MGMT family protein [Brevibacterium sp. Mu109]SMX75479.1 Alkylated DNA nucleotide flippase Atl1, participates in nucleotide excision repair, Ada-like DNA-binding domain [Brevibacterium sp. Mu109]
MDELGVERVLRAVECIPSGRAAAYGEIGRVVGASPRFVARVLSSIGSTVTWWRVPNVRGALPAPLTARALPLWQEEGMPLTPDQRIDMTRAGVDPVAFDQCVRDALADLPSAESEDSPA